MAFTDNEISIVKGMLNRGDKQQDIASYFGVNSARVNEVNTGMKGERVQPAALDTLPPAGPAMAGRSAIRARDTLIALRDLIDEAIGDIDLYERPED